MIAAELAEGNLETLWLILGIACLAGAAWCGFTSRIEACIALIVVGLVCLLVL